jgi:hypothetical protein
MLKKRIKSLDNIKKLLKKNLKKKTSFYNGIDAALFKYSGDDIRNIARSGDISKINKMLINISLNRKNMCFVNHEIENSPPRNKYLLIECLLKQITPYTKIPLHNYLIFAASDGKLSIVKMLLRFKFNTAFDNNQAICKAVSTGHWKIFKLLLTSFLVINDMKPVIYQITKQNKRKYLQYLKEKNLLSPFEITNYAIMCVKYRRLGLLKIILRYKKYYDITDYQAIFIKCIERNFISGVKYLEENFYCKIIKNADYDQWLELSIKNSSHEMLKTIVGFNGIFFSELSIIKKIIESIHKKDYEKFLILYNYKDLDISANGNALLKYTINNDVTEVMEMIVNDNRFLKTKSCDDIFIKAVDKDKIYAVKLFIDNHLVDDNIKQYGLFYAEYNKNKEMIKLLHRSLGRNLDLFNHLKGVSYHGINTEDRHHSNNFKYLNSIYFNNETTPIITV